MSVFGETKKAFERESEAAADLKHAAQEAAKAKAYAFVKSVEQYTAAIHKFLNLEAVGVLANGGSYAEVKVTDIADPPTETQTLWFNPRPTSVGAKQAYGFVVVIQMDQPVRVRVEWGFAGGQTQTVVGPTDIGAITHAGLMAQVRASFEAVVLDILKKRY